MSLVQYGSYNFPNPQPFAAVDFTPVYVGGKLDHSVGKISLIGTITGANLSSLASQKRSLTLGLASEYLVLSIGSESFSCAKPISVSFDESELTTVLPYSIEFESYEDTSFSDYYGIKEPSNVWTYQEEQGRIVKASHSVSAIGVKVDGNDPLESAKTFVNSLAGGFENISLLLAGENAFLLSKTEEIDRQKNSYSLNEEYSFSTSSNKISNNGLVSASSQISYSKENGLQASVNGSIVGALGGTAVSTGDFTPNHAKTLAYEATKNSKSNFEASIYGHIQKGPTSYNYTVNEMANKIDFAFEFKDPDKTSEYKNEVNVSVSASKDSSTVTVSVNGTLTYVSSADAFNSANIENSVKFTKLQTYFATLNFYGMALRGFQDFCAEFPVYDDGGYLNPTPKSENTNKNPYAPSISYEFSYTNDSDLSKSLRNLQISATDNRPITISSVQESVNGFAIQSNYIKKLGSVDANASCDNDAGSLGALQSFLEGLFRSRGKICKLTSKSSTTSNDSISCSFNSIYR
jgi:hypothetical protein